MNVSSDLLAAVCPKCPHAKRVAYLPFLNDACKEFQITTAPRISAFLAQIAHETGGFQWFTEIWGPTKQQERYDPPSNLSVELGNVRDGDGKKYLGRGAIMLTGRGNYRWAGEELGLDLEAYPERAAEPDVCFRIAGLFWRKRGLNKLADAGDFEKITRKINGGLTGQEERLALYQKAQEAIG